MNVKEAIKYILEANHNMVAMYLGDLSDADLLARPAPGANHIAWQLGHLIVAEVAFFLPKVPGVKAPPLPEGFAAQHSKETANSDSGFLTKDEYLALFKSCRDATVAAVDTLSEADLDKPSGWDMAPTIGKLLLTIGNHDMMHAGQFTVVRRKLGKPVLF